MYNCIKINKFTNLFRITSTDLDDNYSALIRDLYTCIENEVWMPKNFTKPCETYSLYYRLSRYMETFFMFKFKRLKFYLKWKYCLQIQHLYIIHEKNNQYKVSFINQ